MEESNSLAIYIIICCIFWVFLIAVVPGQIEDYNKEMNKLYVTTEHIGIVTDKWIKQDTAFFIWGTHDVFILEINNDFTENVEDIVYYSTGVGDYRNWTTRTLKNTLKG